MNAEKSPNAIGFALLSLFLLLPAVASHAQQKFPLKQGEWTMTTPDPTSPGHPMVMNFCLNDQAWSRALTKSSICAVSNLSVTPGGLTYDLACKSQTMQMTGKAQWTFDGMEHIAAKTVMTMTMNGKTSTVTSTGDFRFKDSTCNPNDVNLRNITPH